MKKPTDKRPRMRRPAPVSDLLSQMLHGTPAEQRLKEGRIWLVWDEAVGSRIASHAQPSSFRAGALTISVDSSPWLQQLNYLKKELIGKVNDALEEELVTELQFKGGKVNPSSAIKSPAPPKRRDLSDEERQWIEEQAESVADPELRAVFESLIRKDKESRG
ncbi:DUF721 domain-containing protein [Citrifermentans bremense]|uniref:DUF721 domain-containing protein n=2 Tax=Citrifermentans bremense TaxID=60035 RepID=A0A6S6M4F1_9BACT|nr:DUF721 domain-containing protein [Citrifermentans bremense]